jgi:hypothetical protein
MGSQVLIVVQTIKEGKEASSSRRDSPEVKGQNCYLWAAIDMDIEAVYALRIKERTKRFYNNVNAKTLKSIEELVTAIAIMHNIIRAGKEEVIPT